MLLPHIYRDIYLQYLSFYLCVCLCVCGLAPRMRGQTPSSLRCQTEESALSMELGILWSDSLLSRSGCGVFWGTSICC